MITLFSESALFSVALSGGMILVCYNNTSIHSKIMYDLKSYQTLVVRYLTFLIADDFNDTADLSNELIFTENIVSKSTIIVYNFSQKIEDNTALKNYLLIIISNINLKIIRTEDMFRTLNESY